MYPKKQVLPQPTSIEITKGQGVKEIAELLENKNVINNKWLFYWMYFTKRKPLQAGIFRFEKGESIYSIFDKIAKGDVYEEQITIPEGWRAEQIAQLLSKKDFVDYETFMAVVEDKEGTLFPDTYRVAKKTTAETVVGKLEDNYKERVKDLNPSNKQLILASIIEREAKFDEDRPLVASVFYNRLKIGMKLESDVTVEYGIDNQKLETITMAGINQFVFWTPLKPGESRTANSEYNTYKIPALPPTPISNPGLKSIKAAINPATSDYYYFLTDSGGKAHFAKTKAEHDQNIGKYLN